LSRLFRKVPSKEAHSDKKSMSLHEFLLSPKLHISSAMKMTSFSEQSTARLLIVSIQVLSSRRFLALNWV
jgi:hypothetical protein